MSAGTMTRHVVATVITARLEREDFIGPDGAPIETAAWEQLSASAYRDPQTIRSPAQCNHSFPSRPLRAAAAG